MFITSNKKNLYYQTLDWQTYLKYFSRRNKEKFLKVLRKDMKTANVFLTSSGRAAIILSLTAAKINRHDEVFIPRFLSACVLSSISQCGHPTLKFTKDTKAVLLHHQWGFPQDFPVIQKVLNNRKVLIIEDCAHGLWGETSGVKIGEFGDTAIFSLAKIFEITYAGAIKINNKKYLKEIIKRLNYKISPREYWEAVRGEWTYLNFYRKPIKERNQPDFQVNLQKWYSTFLIYPALKRIIGKLPRNREELKEVFKKQNNNFLFLLKNLKNKSFLLNGDCLEEMAPLCYPFFSKDESILMKVDNWLRKRGIYTGIYHFDINRNMFKQNFKKSVPIPIYDSIDKNLLKSFVRKFKEVS